MTDDRAICLDCYTPGNPSYLEYDFDALIHVCLACGFVASQGEYHTLAGSLAEGGDPSITDTTGRTVVAQPTASAPIKVVARVGQYQQSATSEVASARRQREEVKIRDAIAKYCHYLNLPAIAARAQHFFALAHEEWSFRLGEHAQKWLVASLILAAHEAGHQIDAKVLLQHFKQEPKVVRRCKFSLLGILSMDYKPPATQAVRLDRDVLEAIVDVCERLTSTTRDDAESESDMYEQEERVALLPANASFLQAVLATSPRVVDLAMTLSSRFQHNRAYFHEGPFALACFLFAGEALALRPVPHRTNLAAVLAPYSRSVSIAPSPLGTSASVIGERYRALAKWAADVFLTLPWIPEEDRQRAKGDLIADDGPDSAAIEQAVLNKKGGRGKKVARSKAAPVRKRLDLIPYYEEIVRYEPAPPSGPHSPPAPAPALAVIPVREPAHVRVRCELIDRAHRTVQHMLQPSLAPAGPLHVHDANQQQFMRVLLAGQGVAELKASQALAHALVEPPAGRTLGPANQEAAAYRARVAQLTAAHGTLDAVDIDELFMPGELDAYCRTEDEMRQYQVLLRQLEDGEGSDDAAELDLVDPATPEADVAAPAPSSPAETSPRKKRKERDDAQVASPAAKRRRRAASSSSPTTDIHDIHDLIDPQLLYPDNFEKMRALTKSIAEGAPLPL